MNRNKNKCYSSREIETCLKKIYKNFGKNSKISNKCKAMKRRACLEDY